MTDGLNFGNPEQPHVYWQFKEAVQGIADAAETMGTPVISGNVSFYNQSELGEVPPTPLIGMLGILEDAADRLPSAPTGIGHLALLDIPLEEGHGLGASAYLAYVHDLEDGRPMAPNMDKERVLGHFLSELAAAKKIASAHDSSEGGLAVALAELAISGIKVEVTLPGDGRIDAALFGEVPGRVLVGLPDRADGRSVGTEIAADAKRLGLRLSMIGSYGPGEGLAIRVGTEGLTWNMADLREAYNFSIEKSLNY